MNRELNLISSLYSWINVQEISEIIIVDWSSKNLINNNTIIQNLLTSSKKKFHIIRVNNQEYFSLPKSYNIGVKYVTNDIILKLDCDYANIDSSWIQFLPLKNNLLNNCFISGDFLYSGKSLSGFLVINKKDFIYYNEQLHGWGYEDIDLYLRLKKNNLSQIIFFLLKKYVNHIDHTDEDRVKHYKEKNLYKSNIENKNISEKNTDIKISKFQTVLETKNYTVLLET